MIPPVSIFNGPAAFQQPRNVNETKFNSHSSWVSPASRVAYDVSRRTSSQEPSDVSNPLYPHALSSTSWPRFNSRPKSAQLKPNDLLAILIAALSRFDQRTARSADIIGIFHPIRPPDTPVFPSYQRQPGVAETSPLSIYQRMYVTIFAAICFIGLFTYVLHQVADNSKRDSSSAVIRQFENRRHTDNRNSSLESTEETIRNAETVTNISL